MGLDAEIFETTPYFITCISRSNESKSYRSYHDHEDMKSGLRLFARYWCSMAESTLSKARACYFRGFGIDCIFGTNL